MGYYTKIPALSNKPYIIQKANLDSLSPQWTFADDIASSRLDCCEFSNIEHIEKLF